jgi:acyl carrier protein
MIEKTLDLAVKKFNAITPKKKINNIQKFKISSKYDSLDIINLAICIEEEFKKKKISIKFSSKLDRVFKNYTSLLKEIKKNV